MRRFFCALMLILTAPLVRAADSPEALGFGFGIGLENYKQRYIDSASTNGPDRIVVVEREYRTLPSAWLTLNFQFSAVDFNPDGGEEPNEKSARRLFLGRCNHQTAKGESDDTVNCVGAGLFVGLKVLDANNKTFGGVALGPQYTFYTAGRRISIGAGYVWHQVKTLAPGIEEGKPLPSHYTDIKYSEKSERSSILMISIRL